MFWVGILYTFSLFFISKSSQYIELLDLFTHTYLSEFFINLYYFFWVQFFLLPLLFLFILYACKFICLKSKNFAVLILYIFMFVWYLWFSSDYYFMNKECYHYVNWPSNFNNLLWNPLNKYHPFIFFLVYISLYNNYQYLIFVQNFRINTAYSNYSPLVNYKVLMKKNYLQWLFLFVSLNFGSWWAFQEGSWGGWWNWDASEVFGLIILSVFILMLHLPHKSLPSILKFINFISWILLVTIVYITLQVSYDLVSHNFGLNLLSYSYVKVNFIFFGFVTAYLYLKLYWLSYALGVVSTIALNISYNGKFKKFNQACWWYIKYTYMYIFTAVIINVYVLPFNPILNTILWKIISFETLNQITSSVNWRLGSLVLLYIFILHLNSYYITLYYTIFSYNIISWAFIINNLHKTSLLYILHYLFIMCSILPILLSSSTFILWESFNYSNIIYNTVICRNFFSFTTSFDNFSTILTNFRLSNLTSYIVLNSFFWDTTTTIIQFFILDCSDSLTKQFISYNAYAYLFSVEVNEIVPSLLDNFFWITIIIVLYIVRKIKRLYYSFNKIFT